MLETILKAPLVKMVESEIVPLYKNFDDGHNVSHVKSVIKVGITYFNEFICTAFDNMKLISTMNINKLYAACAYHDTGLEMGREDHEKNSGIYVRKCKYLKDFFNEKDIEEIAQAVEDHRASAKESPRNIYGSLVAAADRNTSIEQTISRFYGSNIKKHPEWTRDMMMSYIARHAKEKFGTEGYAWKNLNIRLPSLTKMIREVAPYIDDEVFFKSKILLWYKEHNL